MIIVEFSLAQKAFHRQSFKEMITNNLINILQRKQADYVPIAFFDTNEEASQWITDNYDKIKDYTMYKSLTSGNVMVK